MKASRIELVRCAEHQGYHGHGGAYGTSCRECAEAQAEAYRTQRRAELDVRTYALAGVERVKGAETGAEAVAA